MGSENKFPKISELRVVCEKRDDKTIMSEKFFTPPFKVMLPIYERTDDVMQVLLLMSAPGIMEGDIQKFDFTIKEGAKAEYCTQSYEKVHRMIDGQGTREVFINVEKDGFFYYHPLPIMPYKDSAVENDTVITLQDDSAKLVYEEILCSGRVACGESFDYRYFNNIVSVRKAGKLIYRDNTQYRPDEFDMEGIGMFEGYTHLANQVHFNMNRSDDWIAEVENMIKDAPDMDGGCTRLSTGDVVVRFFGKSADPMEKLLKAIEALNI